MHTLVRNPVYQINIGLVLLAEAREQIISFDTVVAYSVSASQMMMLK